MVNGFKSAALIGTALFFISGCSGSSDDALVSAKTIDAIIISSVPKTLDKACGNGSAKLYDECSDQIELLKTAQNQAASEGKSLLVTYGAEWCIWCHVFEAYINGHVDRFTYTYGTPRSDERHTHTMREKAARDVSQDAYDLKKYVSENFVVLHVEYQKSPNGDEVLAVTDAQSNFGGGIPYIYSVDESGKYAAGFNSDYAEIRRDTYDWYRGYDRVRLLEELKRMRSAAIGKGGTK